MKVKTNIKAGIVLNVEVRTDSSAIVSSSSAVQIQIAL
jgi:hypothetical protein